MHKRTVTIIPDIVRVVATICANCSRPGNKVRPSNLIVGHTSSRKQQQSPAEPCYYTTSLSRYVRANNVSTEKRTNLKKRSSEEWSRHEWSSCLLHEKIDFSKLLMESINPQICSDSSELSWLFLNIIISYLYLIMCDQFSTINVANIKKR